MMIIYAQTMNLRRNGKMTGKMDKAIKVFIIFTGLILIKIATLNVMDIPYWFILLIFLILVGEVQ